jgi:hypothetical protein
MTKMLLIRPAGIDNETDCCGAQEQTMKNDKDNNMDEPK